MKKQPQLTRWPKKPIVLSDREIEIRELIQQEFQQWGYTGLIGWVQNLGHRWIEKMSRFNDNDRHQPLSLEIGCGSGWHYQMSRKYDCFGVDLRYNLLASLHSKIPNLCLLQADSIQLPFPDALFDRVLSIYVFEHLPSLPDCLSEIRRVMKTDGELLVGLPSEGSLIYDIGRYLTSRRHFTKKYDVDYMKIIKAEHCNTYKEVFNAIQEQFTIDKKRYLPFILSPFDLSAIVVLRARAK